VNAKVGAHPTQLTGSDGGRPSADVRPPAFTGGSSVSHWDVGHTPNTLMEPFINTDLHNSVDLTRYVFADIGWDPASTAIALSLFSAEGRTGRRVPALAVRGSDGRRHDRTPARGERGRSVGADPDGDQR
jgi:hypothetical protein